MTIRSIAVLILLVLGGIQAIQCQTTNAPAGVRSHVERFSTREVRAGRDEADANAKLTASPNNDQALNARALARMRLARYNEAFDDLRRAVSLKPANGEYQANLGYVLWKLGRPEDAVKAERAALKLDPKHFNPHDPRARCLA